MFEVECPHCNGTVLIEQLNCCIFRHGIIKSTMQQINPHAPKIECDRLVEFNQILGCGKPFRVIKQDKYVAVICDYI